MRHKRYMPIDTWLELPSNRIIRALRHFDWIGAGDFCDALDIGEHEREAFMRSLFRLASSGSVQRRTVRTFRGRENQYRLRPGVVARPPLDTKEAA